MNLMLRKLSLSIPLLLAIICLTLSIYTVNAFAENAEEQVKDGIYFYSSEGTMLPNEITVAVDELTSGNKYAIFLKEVKGNQVNNIVVGTKNNDVTWKYTADDSSATYTISTINLKKGYLSLLKNPPDAVNQSGTVTATYNGKEVSIKVKFTLNFGDIKTVSENGNSVKDSEITVQGISPQEVYYLTPKLNGYGYAEMTYFKENISVTSSNQNVVNNDNINIEWNEGYTYLTVTVKLSSTGTTTLNVYYSNALEQNALVATTKLTYNHFGVKLRNTNPVYLNLAGEPAKYSYYLENGYDAKDIVCVSSDESVAVVGNNENDKNITVTPKKLGRTKITLKILEDENNSKYLESSMTVCVSGEGLYRLIEEPNPAEGVNFNNAVLISDNESIDLNGENDKAILYATEKDKNNNNYISAVNYLFYYSDNTNVVKNATNDGAANPVFSPVANGSAKIYVYQMNYTDSPYSGKIWRVIPVTVSGMDNDAADIKTQKEEITSYTDDQSVNTIKFTDGKSVEVYPADNASLNGTLTSDISAGNVKFALEMITTGAKNVSESDLESVEQYKNRISSYLSIVDSDGEELTVDNGGLAVDVEKVFIDENHPAANIAISPVKELSKNRNYTLIFNIATPTPYSEYSIFIRPMNIAFHTAKGNLAADGQSEITLNETTLKYGSEPSITVKYDGTELVKDRDYTVTYIDAENKTVQSLSLVGSYTAVITGIGDYEGTVEKEFKIVPEEEVQSVIDKIMDLGDPDKITTDEYYAVIDAKEAYDALSDDEKSRVSYADNLVKAVNALVRSMKADLDNAEGNIKSLETQIKNLEGQIKELQAVVKEQSKINLTDQIVNLENTEYTYTGSAIEPAVSVSGLNASDYTVTYANNTDIGKASVTITGIGDNSKGSVTKTFTISPSKASLSKVKKGKNKITVKIKAQTGDVSYQIYAKQKGKTAKLYNAGAKTTKVIKKLKKNKTYKVKVRAYKVVDGTTYYGAWSKVNSVRTK